MNKIFYIMGKSASGKDKIYKALLADKELGLKPLILYTTRPQREGEEDGREYYFVEESRYEEFLRRGKVIESRSYHTVCGIWTYFTADDGQTDLQKNSCLAIGTLESCEKLVHYFGREAIAPIYIEVEDGERLLRALKREGKEEHPNYQEVCRRFLADCEDFSEEKIFQAGIEKRFENKNLEDCIEEIRKYILTER